MYFGEVILAALAISRLMIKSGKGDLELTNVPELLVLAALGTLVIEMPLKAVPMLEKNSNAGGKLPGKCGFADIRSGFKNTKSLFLF